MINDDEVLNPVDVERRIRELANQIAKGVRIRSDAYNQYLEADREYDLAFARAFMAYDGPATKAKYAAEIITTEARAVRDAADVAHRYAESRGKALEAELRAMQSVGASVRTMYGNS